MKNGEFPLEKNQNYWQLTCIQTASLGLAGITMSRPLAEKYGAGTVIPSILIANLILWFIALAIVSMSITGRSNAIENAKDYIGMFWTKFAAIISMTIFPIWYALQIQSTTGPIDNSIYEQPTQHAFASSLYGIILGVLIASLAKTGLLKTIKRLNVVFLPVLSCYYLYTILFVKDVGISFNGLSFSWSCIAIYVSFLFAGVVNLPTFFRHARSKYDAYIAITLITVIVSLFEIASIWIRPQVLTGSLFPNSTGALFSKIVNAAFAVTLLTCSNLVNLYFSYPSWEFVIPRIRKHPKFLIIGLFGTLIYALLRFSPDIHAVLRVVAGAADNCIANLGVALLLVFAVRMMVRHRPRPFEKTIGAVSWIIGCIATTIAVVQQTDTSPLIIGIRTTLLSFAVIIFTEEPFWSFKKLQGWLTRKG